MSVEHSDTGSTQTGALTFIDANWHDLQTLPAPDETFVHYELDEDVKQHFKKLVARSIIKPVERDRPDNGTDEAAVWQTQERCYERLQDAIERAEKQDGFLPCGHDPFVNEGDTLRCKRCGEPHDKEAVR